MAEIIKGEFYEKYKGEQPNWGFNGLGYITYKRTYARPVDGENRTEEWHETVKRCVDWLYTIHQELDMVQPLSTYQELYDYVFNLKMNFSGRVLWQAGTTTVDTLGGASLCNCWAVNTNSKKAFLNTFDYLMLGGGVGFNIQRKYVDQLPPIKEGVEVKRLDTKDADFIVPDSREGWVSLLDKTLTAFFDTGQSFTYSTMLIRSKGEPIKGFGGKASGPEPLVYGIEQIVKVLQSREGMKLRPIDVLDIMNILGSIVVAGNVRRSAQIALGDADDREFLQAKRWDLYNLPHWRAMSNNTVVTDDINKLPDEFWEGYKGNGEPYGLFNLPLAQAKGRIEDNHRADPHATATNPCSEITLAPNDKGGAESCNLSEIYLNNLETVADFKKAAKLAHLVTKTITLMQYHEPETNKIVHANHRIGIGITGIAQSPQLTQPEVLTEVYRFIEKTDLDFSTRYGVKPSIKLTTVKPSGTLSLLAGSTPGIHPVHNTFYIRRIRMAANDSLVQVAKNAGFNVEYVKNLDGSTDRNTVVVEFPVHESSDTPTRHDWSAVDMLEMVEKFQKYWSDNQVSVTVSYRHDDEVDELPAIQQYLKEAYTDNIKSVSFLMTLNHGFPQAPYEDIDEDTYYKMMEGVSSMEFRNDVELNTLKKSEECDTGGCPVR